MPAELREHIYSWLYGDLVIHVAKPELPYGNHPCRYYLCQSPLTPSERYQHTLLGASPESPHRWASPMLQAQYYPSAWHRECRCGDDVVWLYVPLVCKRFLREVESLVYRTATWYFVCPDDLDWFAWRGAMAQRVRRLALLFDFGRGPCDWSAKLGYSSLDRFKNLQGLDLVLRRNTMNATLRMDFRRGLMDERDEKEEFSELRKCLKVFRGRGLKERWTTVVVVVKTWPFNGHQEFDLDTSNPVEDRLELARRVREVLLE